MSGVHAGIKSNIAKGVKPIVDKTSKFEKNIKQQKQLFNSAKKTVDAILPAGFNYLGRIAVFGYIQKKGIYSNFLNLKQTEEFGHGGFYLGDKFAGDDFGNYAYGIAAREMGLDIYTALIGAGMASTIKNIKDNRYGAIDYFNILCFGDETKDSYVILRGYMFGGKSK